MGDNEFTKHIFTQSVGVLVPTVLPSTTSPEAPPALTPCGAPTGPLILGKRKHGEDDSPVSSKRVRYSSGVVESALVVNSKSNGQRFNNFYTGIHREFKSTVSRRNFLAGKPTTMTVKGVTIVLPPVDWRGSSRSRKDRKFRKRLGEKDKVCKIWEKIAKRDVPKRARDVALQRSSNMAVAKRTAHLAQKEVRRNVYKKFREFRDNKQKVKKVVREMLQFWRKHEKTERDSRKQAQKEAAEKRRVEEEMREAKRQARKLNFLLTQTELYSHFIGSKAEEGQSAPQPNRSGVDNDEELAVLQAEARAGATAALQLNENRMKIFDAESERLRADAADVLGPTEEEQEASPMGPPSTGQSAPASSGGAPPVAPPVAPLKAATSANALQQQLDQVDLSNPDGLPQGMETVTQPRMLQGQLKGYQMKGLNWLINLYEQGINGILADEMGLGKTVQAISLMSYLAESKGIWGPFLVVAPSSTLHNWQQEVGKFAPDLKVLPYWGNQKDRKVLRKYWNHKELYHERAAFHVLITSYQLVVRDELYFKRIKWQYMILDEAQALKSSRSNRWKTLLGFSCRNRLLLTGTPIQNSMAELWALLHFIMPSLFDSHAEFNEWFSKDIEATAKNQSGAMLSDHQLSRLRLILKPFMLRRVKTQVEHELGKKIEVELSCDMSTRQARLYSGIKARVSLAELLLASSDNNTEHLMNLVMQFRKVCNHPEIFERRDAESPWHFANPHAFESSFGKEHRATPAMHNLVAPVPVPALLYNEGTSFLDPALTGDVFRASMRTRLLQGTFSLFHPEHVHTSLFSDNERSSFFSFTRFCNVSPAELSWLHRSDDLNRWLARAVDSEREAVLHHTTCPWSGLAASYDGDDEGEEALEAPGSQRAFLRAHARTRHLLLSPRTRAAVRCDRRQSQLLPGLVVTDPMERFEQWERLIGLTQRVIPRVAAPPISISFSHRRGGVMQDRLMFGSWGSKIVTGVDTSMWAPAVLPYAPFIPSSLGVDTYIAADGQTVLPVTPGLLTPYFREFGSSQISVPDFSRLLADSGKLRTFDTLLSRLKREGHRVLVYSQMTKMLDILEDYMYFRGHTYVRLDGSSQISERRDVVEDFQTRGDIFCFLLSTRAGGLGINLTAADTVIFYDSDWNPTQDLQAMDRAHRLGQTKQVTVYRLITTGTIEERILQRAKQKKTMQQLVISGEQLNAPSELGGMQGEAISLLLDDDELSLAAQLQARDKEKKQKKKEATRATKARNKKERERRAKEAEDRDGALQSKPGQKRKRAPSKKKAGDGKPPRKRGRKSNPTPSHAPT